MNYSIPNANSIEFEKTGQTRFSFTIPGWNGMSDVWFVIEQENNESLKEAIIEKLPIYIKKYKSIIGLDRRGEIDPRYEPKGIAWKYPQN